MRVTFECHGVLIAVRSADPVALDALPPHLPPGARARPDADAREAAIAYAVTRRRDATPGRAAYVVRLDTEPGAAHEVARSTDRATALAALGHDAEFRIACAAPDDVFLHAGVVALDGRAVLFPGYSFAGKSTLVAALVRAGAVYYSDEFAVLTGGASVAPFARRIATRNAAGEPGPRVRAEALGGRVGVEPLPIGAVVATRYVPGAHWRPARLTRGQTVLTLLEHAVAGRLRPGHTLARVSAAVDDAVIGLAGDRGPAEEAAPDMLQVLRRSPGWAGMGGDGRGGR